MPRPVNYNDRTLIVGKTTSGKSVIAGYLIAAMTGCRRVVIDPKGMLQLGVEPVRDVARIDWAAPIIHYIPTRFTPDEYEELYEAVFFAGGPMLVYTDESGGVGPTKAGFAPRYLTALQAQGAQLGMGHIYCAQRPKNIASELRTECEHCFLIGPPPPKIDIDTLAADLGVQGGGTELTRRIREAREHEGEYAFLWYSRAGDELVTCAPIPL